MAAQDLDALVVRSPDNILYLTNYWSMKGYDIAIFPREGDPTLLVIEPQFREAQRTAWCQRRALFQVLSSHRSAASRLRALLIWRWKFCASES